MPSAIRVAVSTGERQVLDAWRSLRGAFLGWGVAIIMTAGAVLLAFGADHTVLFRTGIACTAVGVACQFVTGPRLKRLIDGARESDARARERASTLTSILEQGMRALMEDLSVNFIQARASVYRHKDDHFILLLRLSDAPDLARTGRDQYPDSEGVIGQAWSKKEKVVTGLPFDRAEWERACVHEYGMSTESARGISMKSLSLLAKRIDSPQAQPVGMIVIESLNKRGVTGTTLDELLRSHAYRFIEKVLFEAITRLDEQDVAARASQS